MSEGSIWNAAASCSIFWTSLSLSLFVYASSTTRNILSPEEHLTILQGLVQMALFFILLPQLFPNIN